MLDLLFHIMLQLSCILYATSAEMSPGLAALTVGCDSGDLGSLSRVQLLLLDRSDPVEPHWLAGQDKYSPTEDRTTDLTAELRARRPLSPRLYTTGIPDLQLNTQPSL